jgi:hypothetical protein
MRSLFRLKARLSKMKIGDYQIKGGNENAMG